ncbi:MAG: hypothetical protein J5545_11755, partial [Bacteroidaceae bacterium]|nr:hypothetical protein [Bacteroidaceae bacterium]
YLKARVFLAIAYQPMNWLATLIMPLRGFELQCVGILAKLELIIFFEDDFSALQECEASLP